MHAWLLARLGTGIQCLAQFLEIHLDKQKFLLNDKIN